MLDSRGFFIESAARNITIQEVAQHLNIKDEYLIAKLFSDELLTLADAVRIKELLHLQGSNISVDGLFFDDQGAA